MTRVRPTVVKVFESSYGRSAGGESAVAYSFSVTVPAMTNGTFNFPDVTQGNEFIHQFISVSCDDDTAIHRIALSKSGVVFFIFNFLTGGISDFPGETLVFGEILSCQIRNRSLEELHFEGVLNTTIRKV